MGRLPAVPLFVPGDRPDRVAKARARGARAIVIDLEDAVAPARKDTARAALAPTLSAADTDVAYLVRVDIGDDGAIAQADLAALREVLPRISAVILPKVTDAEMVRAAAADLGDNCPAIVPTVETAAGIRAAWEIAAASPAVHTLLFGPVDLSADLGVTISAAGAEMSTARSTVVLACAAAGVAAPLDGPWVVLNDPDGLTTAARHARALGFGGKAAIHPDQLPVLHAEFAPTEAEIRWAASVVAAYETAVNSGIGAIRLTDGTFIDPPVAARARRILAHAQAVAP